MANKEPQDVTEPLSNAEKFKPKNVQANGKAGPGLPSGNGPDISRGAEHHLQRKSMHRP
ncbi:hypothetical protein [Paraurantiacibacter namhicola]|uniref:Uncharacterized protein n=1 Tax=Paraurantiacibacter namhicola TaxID=645517 RepID=A0A1C7D8Q4_9SPHN|nr:hypothetical protein [Paraurantiacibacter namhicola]ANU07701.1 hypothetical protein A6F65_01395 [Paraurantiacibacter namhicola]